MPIPAAQLEQQLRAVRSIMQEYLHSLLDQYLASPALNLSDYEARIIAWAQYLQNVPGILDSILEDDSKAIAEVEEAIPTVLGEDVSAGDRQQAQFVLLKYGLKTHNIIPKMPTNRAGDDDQSTGLGEESKESKPSPPEQMLMETLGKTQALYSQMLDVEHCAIFYFDPESTENARESAWNDFISCFSPEPPQSITSLMHADGTLDIQALQQYSIEIDDAENLQEAFRQKQYIIAMYESNARYRSLAESDNCYLPLSEKQMLQKLEELQRALQEQIQDADRAHQTDRDDYLRCTSKVLSAVQLSCQDAMESKQESEDSHTQTKQQLFRLIGDYERSLHSKMTDYLKTTHVPKECKDCMGCLKQWARQHQVAIKAFIARHREEATDANIFAFCDMYCDLLELPKPQSKTKEKQDEKKSAWVAMDGYISYKFSTDMDIRCDTFNKDTKDILQEGAFISNLVDQLHTGQNERRQMAACLDMINTHIKDRQARQDCTDFGWKLWSVSAIFSFTWYLYYWQGYFQSCNIRCLGLSFLLS